MSKDAITTERKALFTFTYSDSDLNICSKEDGKFSVFDNELRNGWDKAMAAGCFRYDLSELKTKPIPGPHGYVGLLNEKRATDRRKPEHMQSLNQPFDESKFNFNKVKDEEILMVIRNTNRGANHNDQLIINVSPVDYGHSLIVPEVDSNHNQNLTEHGLRLSLEIMCLSAVKSFKMGFNSLCGHASVNHQHLHCYYANETLLAETVTASPLGDHIYKLDSDAPLGFGFELTQVEDIPLYSRLLYKCTDHMRKQNIAYALFICRGPSFISPTNSASVVRILLWPRVKVLGEKPAEEAFNSAVLEMAGHLLVKERNWYDEMTDETAYKILKESSLPDDEFEQLSKTLTHTCQNCS